MLEEAEQDTKSGLPDSNFWVFSSVKPPPSIMSPTQKRIGGHVRRLMPL